MPNKYTFRLQKLERSTGNELIPIIGYVRKTDNGYSVSIHFYNFQEREQSRTSKHEKDSFLTEQSAADYIERYLKENYSQEQIKNFILYTSEDSILD